MRWSDWRIILHGLGLASVLVGIVTAASLLVVLMVDEPPMLTPFAVSASFCIVLGIALYVPLRGGPEARISHGLIIAALGWLLAAALGALPFFLAAWLVPGDALRVFRNFGSAFFESMSGFTTTGLSLVTRPELLPRSLVWWRSFTQWIGGIGIIVLVLGLTTSPSRPGRGMFFAERDEKIQPSIRSTIQAMWWIYVMFTGLGTILLWSLGMGIWDAANHAMTALSTGGFSTRASSIGAFGSVGPRLGIILLEIIGAMSFSTHYDLLQGRTRWRETGYQARWLVVLCGAFSLLLFVEFLVSHPSTGDAPAVFQAISAATTTGFQTVSVSSWSQTAKLILIAAMFVGGATGSTAGGIKVIRAIYLVRGIGWWLRRVISSPRTLLRFRVGREILPEEEASRRVQGAAVIAVSWIVCILASTVVLLHVVPSNFTLADVLFEVTSAQSTVGLSVGITGPGMSELAKYVLCANMWIGRLEVLPAIMLIRSLVRGLG